MKGRKTLLRVGSMLSILLIGYVDYITGYELSLILFYFVPIAVLAWYDTRRVVLAAAILSTFAWVASDYLAGSIHSHAFYRWWDGLVKGATFILVGRLIYRTRRTLEEKDKTNQELQRALDEISELRDMVPICAYCKSVRNDRGFYEKIEVYLKRITGQRLTHGICPECTKTYFVAVVPPPETPTTASPRRPDLLPQTMENGNCSMLNESEPIGS